MLRIPQEYFYHSPRAGIKYERRRSLCVQNQYDLSVTCIQNNYFGRIIAVVEEINEIYAGGSLRKLNPFVRGTEG